MLIGEQVVALLLMRGAHTLLKLLLLFNHCIIEELLEALGIGKDILLLFEICLLTVIR